MRKEIPYTKTGEARGREEMLRRLEQKILMLSSEEVDMVTEYLNKLEAEEDVSDLLEKARAEQQSNSPN